MTRVDWNELLLRAAVTAVEAATSVILAAGFTNLDIDVAKTALIAGLGAGTSVLYNSLRAWWANR